MADYNDGSFKENYIYIKESGLLWSSTVLAPRLKQPQSNRPVPYSKAYVCDFELDFISKDDTDVLLAPIRDLKERNDLFQTGFDDIVAELETVQVNLDSMKEQCERF